MANNAGGGYILPQHVFVPHPATRPLSGPAGHVPNAERNSGLVTPGQIYAKPGVALPPSATYGFSQ
jgi:hypothetical protein